MCQETRRIPSLVTIAVDRLTQRAATELIPDVILERYVWEWHMMPYSIFYSSLLRLAENDPDFLSHTGFRDARIDEWIIKNEKWLQKRHSGNWKHGMVSFADADIVFPNSVLGPSVRIIERLDNLPGFSVLGEARELQLRIQRSVSAFKSNFDIMSQGLLRNLDWNNLIVAGGLVLGTLLNPRYSSNLSKQDCNQWVQSDIDIYIWGLSSRAANEKIHHIFEVFRCNLPPQQRTLAVRNPRTITLYADYPTRRVQIVLKLASTPKDVLLNFDLDICAMGWDGTNVWMLPRAARALETGYNIFTMSLIHGHHLSERRETQLERLFKYAQKGYGLRFLPHYLAALPSTTDVTYLAQEARHWIKDQYTFVTTDFGSEHFLRSDLGIPRSRALSNFTLLMRHIAFWEMERNDWASTSYENTVPLPSSSYRYTWNQHFNPAKFAARIIESNIQDVDAWLSEDLDGRLHAHGVMSGDDLNRAQRMTSATNLQDLLEHDNDIRIPVLLPIEFASHANKITNEVLTEIGLQPIQLLEPAIDRVGIGPDTPEGLFMWIIGSHLMWQHLDRRIDE
ncbi:hypothetical protein R3P38DRAFT_3322436 [Favolaschia claudopus]|uniref:Uncharacterized protein n=1 Tax=Favolaschia claudopus TaxID=2862362 RepID=A0AAW0AL21_9AGAR